MNQQVPYFTAPQQFIPPRHRNPPRPQPPIDPIPQDNNRRGNNPDRPRDCVYDRTRPIIEPYLSSTEINALEFELRPALITMIQNNQFAGRPQEDPYMHLKNYIASSGTIRYRNVDHDQVRACLFQFSLHDMGREWFETLSNSQKAN